jgi:hypothetical protein
MVLCGLIIVGSITALFFQFRPPKEDTVVHEAVGEIMAEQIPTLTNNARVVVITLDSSAYPVLGLRRAGFERAVKNLPGVKVLDWEEVDPKGKPKYGAGRGLSGEKYVRLVKKNPEGNVFVSFIGAPEMEKEDLKELPSPAPILLCESRAREELLELFDKGALHAAIVPRFTYPAPEGKPKTPRQKFDLFWQILNPKNIPRDEASEKD